MKKIIIFVLIASVFISISNSQNYNGFKKIKTITEREFFRYPYYNFEKDYDTTNIIKSQNGILQLKITSGEPVTLTNIIDSLSDGSESYSHLCNLIDYYVLEVYGYESISYILVNKNNGTLYRIEEKPRLSPDRKYIFVYGGSLELIPSLPVFQVWEVLENKLQLIIDIDIVNYQYLIKSIRWLTNNSFAIQIEKGAVGEIEYTYEILELSSNIQNHNDENIDANLLGNNFTLLQNANLKLEQKDYDGAMEDYTKAIEINPKSEIAFYCRGNLYYLLKNYHEAIDDYNKTIELNSDYAEAYFYRAIVEGILENKDEAIADYSKVIEINPTKYPEAYFNRGLLKADKGDYMGAIADFSSVIEIEPKAALAYVNRGTIKTFLKDLRGAIVDFSKAIEINPNYIEAYNFRGLIKNELKDYQGAIIDFKKIILLEPENSQAYFNIGNVKIDTKDYKGAITDFTKAIEINSKYAEAYYYRGFAKIILRQKNNGCLDFSKAGELGFSKAYDAIKKYCQ